MKRTDLINMYMKMVGLSILMKAIFVPALMMHTSLPESWIFHCEEA